MEQADLERLVEELQRDRDKLREDHEKLRHEYDVLAGKLRYPGTDFLVKLEYAPIFDSTITATSADITISAPFDTIPGTGHASYLLSAYVPTSNTPVIICDGSIIVAPSNTIAVAIQRSVDTGPTRTVARVVLYNSAVLDYDVSVRVWKRLGLR